MGKVKRERQASGDEIKKAVKELFPRTIAPAFKAQKTDKVVLFKTKELMTVAQKIKNGKEPGLDGIPPEVIKTVLTHATEKLLETFNYYVAKQEFPDKWKEAELVLIPRGTTEVGRNRKFRPICLLNCLGKAYKQLITARLQKKLKTKGGLSDKQFGFRPRISTVDTVKEVLKFANSGT